MSSAAAGLPLGSDCGEALDALGRASRIVLSTHHNADGDGAGSEAALAMHLAGRGKHVRIVNPTPFPEAFAFLLDDASRVLPVGGQEAADACREADLAVVLDTSEAKRIGPVHALIRHLPAVVIDHHPAGADGISGIVVRDTTAAATGEMVFALLERDGAAWTPQMAAALYTAVLTDTGGFRFSNTTPTCLRTAARLIELGAAPHDLHRRVYGSFRRRRFALLQESLATLEVHESGRVAWMIVPGAAYGRTQASVEDLEGFVDVPRSIRGVEVALLFRVAKDGQTKVSMRSGAAVDVNQLAAAFGGGGHPRAAGAVLPEPMEEAVRRVVGAVVGALAE